MDDEQAKSEDQTPDTHNSEQVASPWDSLAQELGANPTPDAMERPPQKNLTPHQESAEVSEVQRSDDSPEPTKASTIQERSTGSGSTGSGSTGSDSTGSGDWDHLANSLGIAPSPESQARPPIFASPEDSQDDVNSSSPKPATSDQTSAPNEPNEPNEDDAGSRSPESSSPDSSSTIQESETPPEEEKDEALEPWGNISTISEAEQSQVAFAEELDAPSQSPGETDDQDQQGLTGKVAQSVFDALFLSGSTAAEALGSIFSSEKSDSKEPEDADSEPSIPSAAAAVESSPEDKTEGEGEGELQKSKSRRRRPRRRRGGGRGAATRETDRPETSPEIGDRSDTEPNRSEAVAVNQREAETPQDDRPQADASNSEDSFDSENVSKQSAQKQSSTATEGRSTKSPESPTKRPVHRNIPSWQEAMSVIVDRNIEARKKSPSSSDRSAASRGRSRGGRRRKKS